MPAPIHHTNGFRAMTTLRQAAADPRVAEIEGDGMDDGRVFIHFTDCTHSASVGSAADVRDALKRVVKCEGPCCRGNA